MSDTEYLADLKRRLRDPDDGDHEEAAEAIERLMAELADTKDDYLRIHKDKMDLFEQLVEARAAIERYKNALTDIAGSGPGR